MSSVESGLEVEGLSFKRVSMLVGSVGLESLSDGMVMEFGSGMRRGITVNWIASSGLWMGYLGSTRLPWSSSVMSSGLISIVGKWNWLMLVVGPRETMEPRASFKGMMTGEVLTLPAM